MIAVITPPFTTVALRTTTSPAGVCPLELVTLANGGEMTTVAPGLKFAPTSVICARSAPWATNSGEALVRTGEGAGVTVSGIALEVVPPPAAEGLNTVTDSVAGEATSDAKTVAVSCNALRNTVGRLLALIRTTEVGMNPLPFTVRVKLGPPDETEAGERLVIA
jgi:hypothetical protein